MRTFYVIGALIFLNVGFASTQKLSKLTILLPEVPRHEIQGKIELTSGFFNRTFHTIQLKTLSKGKNQVTLSKAEKINDVDFTIDLISTDKLKASLIGTIDLDDNVFETDKILLGDEKYKKEYDCSKVIKASAGKDELVIDLENFKSLSDCTEKLETEPTSSVVERLRPISGEINAILFQELSPFILPVDSEITKYLQNRLDEIRKVSDHKRPSPKVFLVNAGSDKAYALPTGEIYLYKGLLEKAHSESTLMAILAKEWANVETGELLKEAQTIVNNSFTPIAVYISSGKAEDKEKVQTEYVPKAVNGAMKARDYTILNYKPDQEIEADRLSGLYLARTGHHPESVIEFLNTLKGDKAEDPGFFDKFKTSFGNYAERMKKVNYQIQFIYPEEKNWKMDSDEFVAVKEALKNLPAEDTSKLSKLDEALDAKKEKFIIAYMEPLVTYLFQQQEKKKNTPKP